MRVLMTISPHQIIYNLEKSLLTGVNLKPFFLESVTCEQYDLAATWYDDTMTYRTQEELKIHENGSTTE